MKRVIGFVAAISLLGAVGCAHKQANEPAAAAQRAQGEDDGRQVVIHIEPGQPQPELQTQADRQAQTGQGGSGQVRREDCPPQGRQSELRRSDEQQRLGQRQQPLEEERVPPATGGSGPVGGADNVEPEASPDVTHAPPSDAIGGAGEDVSPISPAPDASTVPEPAPTPAPEEAPAIGGSGEQMQPLAGEELTAPPEDEAALGESVAPPAEAPAVGGSGAEDVESTDLSGQPQPLDDGSGTGGGGGG